MTKRLWAGLDVGVESTSICVIDDNGETVHQAISPTNARDVHRELIFLKRRRHAHVGMESGIGTSLARGLRSLGYSVDVYEARKLSKFLRLNRNKTDAGDAHGIAQAGRLGAALVSRVHLKSLAGQILSSRLAIRRHLVRTRVRTTSLLCRQLELFGGRVRVRDTSANFASEVELQIKILFGKTPSPLVTELRYLLQTRDQLMQHQRDVDREMKCVAHENEVCRRFMEIPGVGPICALTFYAAIGEPHRFMRSSDVGAFIGLTPRLHQSGLTQRSGRISKMGPVAARTLLVQSALRFMITKNADPALRNWASKIAARRGNGKARVALARKLAIIMLAMWKSGEPYQPVAVRQRAQASCADTSGLDLGTSTNAKSACRNGNEARPGSRRWPIGPGRPLFYVPRRRNAGEHGDRPLRQAQNA